MVDDRYSPEHPTESRKVLEARYAYYRRCQVFRRNGEQCKAPAEKGSQICHAHAAQRAMAFRRDLERRIVLAEAVAEMRRQGRLECETANLLMDFKGIQVTLAVMSRAVINGRIDCKTAGQMVVHLQTLSKLLWKIQRKGLALINTDDTDLKKIPKLDPLPRIDADDADRQNTRLEKEWGTTSSNTRAPDFSRAQILQFEERAFGDRSRAHSPRKIQHKNLPLINSDDTDQKKIPKLDPLPRIDADDADRKKQNDEKNLVVRFAAEHPSTHALVTEATKILQFEARAFGDRSRAHSPPISKAA